jgi:hypothetical protein
MSDHPFTDDDLRAAAALMHYGLTIEPNPADADAALAENPRWVLVEPGSEDDERLRESTVELVSKAADVSRWAVDIGAEGMEPLDSILSMQTDIGPLVRIHFAVRPDMPEDMRANLVYGLGQEIAKFMPNGEATATDISSEVAAHVLFQERLGGWPPSTFASKLLNLWTSADTDNADRLAAAFPEYGAALALLKSGQTGIEQLRAIADGT